MLHKFMAIAPALLGLASLARFRRDRGPRDNKPTAEDHDKWIWIANPDPVPNSYLQARKSFSLASKPTRAEIKTSADSGYKLFVNGQYVGKGPVRSGEGYAYFDTHDVTDLLVKGANVIALLAHHIGESTYNYIPGRPGLVCKVEIDLDGEKIEFGTDETWRVRRAAEWTDTGARLNGQLGFQEAYDAASAQEGWTEVKFKDKSWEDAAVVGAPPGLPWGELTPRQIPQLREETILPREVVGTYNASENGRDIPQANVPDLMAASELSVLKAGSVKHQEALLADSGHTEIRTPRGDRGVAIILDFGREVFGNVELGIAGSGTGRIDLGYGESLLEGHVKPNVGDTRYADSILLKKGKLAWQSFEPRAFRFVQIEFRRCSKPVSIEYIRVNETTYPAERTGRFECSDRLLNDIWAAGVTTAHLCMEDAFIDTPWRERAQWWGDARVLSRAAYYAFDETKLLAQGLRQIASSQGRDGSILGLYPAGEEMLVPDFAMLWVFSILDYFAFADDAELVHELFPAVEALLNWFAKFEGDNGLLDSVPGTLLIDRADLEREGQVTSLNCLYYQTLRVASALASISEKPEEAEAYLDAANRIKIAINKFTYVPKRGLYAECIIDGKLVEKFSRQTNTFAALFDIADQYQKGGIFRVLSSGSLPEVATPYFASYYLEALYSINSHEQALDYIRRKWGEMVKSGSTTLWEGFKPDGARCHGSATCPTRDLIAEYVGIKPVLGMHRFSVSPHPADLKWARGSVNTRHGELTVEWRVLRNRLDIDVTVPDGLRVDVYPPGPTDSTISVDGRHLPTRFITLTGGIHHVRVNQPVPSRAANYDEATPSLMPHVEVLDRGVRIGRRGVAIEPRRHTRGKRSEAEEPMQVRMDGVVTSEEPIVISAAEAPTGEQPQEASKRRRRSRGGRGRGRAAEPVEATAVPEAAVEAVAPELPAVETAEAPEVAEEAPKRRRRSRGGRGRRRSTSEQTAPIEQAESTQAPLPAAEPVQPEPRAVGAPESSEVTEEAPKRRRRSRGGRGRRRPGAEHAAPSEQAESAPALEIAAEAPVEAPVAEAPEGSEEAAPPKRRRRTRGGRGRRRSSSAQVGEQPITEAPPAEIAPEPPAEFRPTPAPSMEAPEATEPKPRRRSRGGRGRGRATTEQPAAEVTPQEAAPQVITPEPIVESQPVETSEPAEAKPKRRTRGGRTRSRASDAEQTTPVEHVEAAQIPEPPVEPPSAAQQSSSDEQPPKKRRTYRRKTTKPESGDDQASEG